MRCGRSRRRRAGGTHGLHRPVARGMVDFASPPHLTPPRPRPDEGANCQAQRERQFQTCGRRCVELEAVIAELLELVSGAVWAPPATAARGRRPPSRCSRSRESSRPRLRSSRSWRSAPRSSPRAARPASDSPAGGPPRRPRCRSYRSRERPACAGPDGRRPRPASRRDSVAGPTLSEPVGKWRPDRTTMARTLSSSTGSTV